MLTKKLFYAVAFSLPTICFAHASIPDYDWREEDEGIWQLAFEGQYYQQSNNLMELSSLTAANGQYDAGTGRYKNLDLLVPPLGEEPDQNWGYTIYLGYIFAEQEYDLQGSYTGLRSNNKVASSGITNGFTSGRSGPVESPAENGGKFEYNFTEAELTFGQLLEISDPLTLRVGLGIAYVDIDQKTDDAFSNVIGTYLCSNEEECSDATSTTASFKNHFQGLGPKLTFDGQLDINRFFAVVGGLGVSGLYGQSKADFNYASRYYIECETECDISKLSKSTKEKHNQWAVGVDSKLGLRFIQAFNDDIALNIEAGYQATTYFNAMQEGPLEMDISKAIHVTGLIALENFDENYYNYGPYVTIGIDFM